jgi:hypothetical protein
LRDFRQQEIYQDLLGHLSLASGKSISPKEERENLKELSFQGQK